ncbi:MAG: hypothetical protein Q9225_007901, partial [Loekoesia sp. 1 TL-2023]
RIRFGSLALGEDPNQHGKLLEYLRWCQLIMESALQPTTPPPTGTPSAPARSNATSASAREPITPSASYFTPTPTTSSFTSSGSRKRKYGQSTNVNYIGQRMEEHHLFMKHDHLKKTYPAFFAKVKEIIGRPVDVIMQPDSVQAFHNRLEQYRSRKEESFLQACLPLLVKNGRLIRVDPRKSDADAIEAGEVADTDQDGEDTEDNTTPGYRYLLREWEDDGILTAVGEEFHKGFLPSPFPPDLVKAMSKHDGMSNAKPDRCYGLMPSLFPAPSIPVYKDPETMQMISLLDGVWHAFFIIEGKSNGGVLAAAQNQVRRGGATLVHSLRMWLATIGVPDVAPGPDDRTHVFSAALIPDMIEIWVHWAEVLENGLVHYHMDLLDGARFRADDQVPVIRRVIHSILAWGCTERVEQLKPYHAKMYDYFREKEQVRVQERNDAAAEKWKNKKVRTNQTER